MKLVDLNKPIPELNALTLNEVFEDGQVTTFVTAVSNLNGINFNRNDSPNLIIVNGIGTGTVNASIYFDLVTTSSYYFIHKYISGTHNRRFIDSSSNVLIAEANMQQSNTGIFTNSTNLRLSNVNGTIADNYTFGMLLINLTALGIANLTKEQLDNYFALYQSGVEASGFVQKTFSGNTKFALAKGIDAVAHGGLTYREIFDNNLDYDNLPDFNDIPIPGLNGLTLNEVFDIEETYIESFDFITTSQNSYNSTQTYIDENGFNWDILARINVGSVTLGNAADGSYVEVTATEGISNFTVNLVRAFSNTNIRSVELFVNGVSKGTFNISTSSNIVQVFTVDNIDVSGPVVIRLASTSPGTRGAFIVDNFSWTTYTVDELNPYYELYENPIINFIYYKHADTPTGEVSSVNNYYYAAGKNLFDKDNLINGQRISQSTGAIFTSGPSSRSDFISILSSTNYIISNTLNANTRYALYDNSFTFISGALASATTMPITTTSNTYYIIISDITTNIQNIQLQQGTTATTFEAYTPPDNLLNLTLLFGAGNEPDKATMDTLFQQYPEAGTVQAQAFIQTAGKDTRVIDAKLPYLNMMSIREVFESNQITNSFNLPTIGSLTDFSIGLQTGSLYLVSEFVNVVGEVASARFRRDTNNVAPIHTINSNVIKFPNQLNLYNNEFLSFRFGSVVEPFTAIGTFTFVNLTALNLTHLTKAELDAMYALYEAGTLKLSDVFEDNQASSIATLSQTQQDDIAKAYTRYKGPLFIDTDGVAYGQVFISRGGQ